MEYLPKMFIWAGHPIDLNRVFMVICFWRGDRYAKGNESRQVL
jgi:hypothetical protein